MICPNCNGTKKIVGVFPVYTADVPHHKYKSYVEIRCDLCDDAGEVDENHPKRVGRGTEMKNLRIKNNLSLRNAAYEIGTDVVTLSAYERGKNLSDIDTQKILSWYYQMNPLDPPPPPPRDGERQ